MIHKHQNNPIEPQLTALLGRGETACQDAETHLSSTSTAPSVLSPAEEGTAIEGETLEQEGVCERRRSAVARDMSATARHTLPQDGLCDRRRRS